MENLPSNNAFVLSAGNRNRNALEHEQLSRDCGRMSLEGPQSTANRLVRRGVSVLMCEACGDEALEERVGSVRLRLKFRVELTGKEPGMALELDQFD